MSRYLAQLARDTRSRLQPPSRYGFPARAPAVYEEIHEELIVPASAAPPSPLAAPPAPASHTAPPTAPQKTVQAPMPAISSERSVTRQTKPAAEIPALRPRGIVAVVPAANPKPERPAVAGSEPVPRLAPPAPAQPAPGTVAATPHLAPGPATEVRHVISRIETLEPETEVEIVELAAPAASPVAEITHRAPLPRGAMSAADLQVRPRDSVRPAPAAAAKPPAIDVTIGRIEVIVESEPQPPLRAVRPPAPRPAAAATSRLPAAAGRLARQYLDR